MQKAFDVSGPVDLEVRLGGGEIEVDASLDGRVEVELIAHDEESQALVDAATVELHERGNGRPRVFIELPKKRGGFSFGLLFGDRGISCRVRCPEGSAVQTRTGSADLAVRGTIDGLTVATGSGDVEVDDVTGGINVKSGSGDLFARTVGSVNVNTASGEITIEQARGPVNVNTASGDVKIGSADDNVNANTVSGDLELGAVLKGRVAGHSVSGDVTIGIRRGSRVYLDCSTVSGDTRSDLEVGSEEPDGSGPLVDLRAKTVSGDIHITRAPAPMDTQEVHA